MYKVVRNQKYDFSGESYGQDCFPSIHKYPATMIPQVGAEIINEIGGKFLSILDPYCGSGSSFASGLACGITDFTGFDLNPLAIAITKARFTRLNLSLLENCINFIRETAYAKKANGLEKVEIERFNNFDYWFSEKVALQLQMLKNLINEILDHDIKRLLIVALCSTIRDCSYVRNNEFKLYRMKEESLLLFNPDVLDIYFYTVSKLVDIYQKYYHNRLDIVKTSFKNEAFTNTQRLFDIVLTSPPYGDSKTTVAYGQFSMFANSWALGVENARVIDNLLMGGTRTNQSKTVGIIRDQISEISKIDNKRALDVHSFYYELKN